MTHAHMTKQVKAEIISELEDFENSIDDKFRNGRMNEDGRDDIITVSEILRHEIERMAIRD